MVVPKGKIQLQQHNLTLSKPRMYCFLAMRGRKSEIFLRDAMRRGEENQRQGGGNKIKSRSTIHTPDNFVYDRFAIGLHHEE